MQEISVKATIQNKTTTHLLEMIQTKQNLIIASISQGHRSLEFSFVAGGNAKWCSDFGKQFGSFYKVKCTPSI